jgi:membrane protein implicated in regulation of membrane protease activity
MLTTLCLYAVVLGYAVFILPVFANRAAYWNYSLQPSGPDYIQIAMWVVRSTVFVFLGWMLYARRLPREAQPRQLTIAVGTLNVMLGASALMLGVSLVRFAIIVAHPLR